MTKIAFQNKQNVFFKSLKDKVDKYFIDNNLHPAGNSRLFLKSLFQVVSAISLYVVLVFFTPGVFLSILLCMLFGLNMAVIGFNVMHEGGHQTFSKYKWLNKISCYFLNALGGNSYFWKIKHNINHHTYTNIEGMDSDIDIEPMMRLHANQPRFWFHKFQHIYWIFLYGLSYLAWIFYNDFQKYFTGKIAEGASKRGINTKEHIIFWITKLSFVGVYIVLPMVMVGVVEALVGFIIVTFVCGLFIAVVFQLAHVVEDTSFPVPNADTNKIENEWAIHQLNTTANFDTQSRLISWMLGGLNFQIEHHLFPKISHIHYPKISKLVKETCEEFNITYIEYKSAFYAFRSHLSHIRSMGKA